MQELKNEAGRSMVEMLGVLAIIGVLSIVGIAGYKQAMNKIKANEIVNAANQYYIERSIAANGACSAGTTTVTAGAASSAVISVACGSNGANDSVTISGAGTASSLISGMGVTATTNNPVFVVSS